MSEPSSRSDPASRPFAGDPGPRRAGGGPAVGRAIAVLPLALVATSSAAVLVRMIPDASPLSIALWRTAAVGLLLAPTLRPMSARDAALTAIAGTFLAAHFAAWFASLGETTVVRSTVLVCTSPLFAAAFEALAGTEAAAPPRGPRFFAGTAIAILGIGLLAWPEAAGAGVVGATGDGLLGDGLALFAAAAMGGYLVIGRRVRRHVELGPYASGVCLCAATVLGIAAAVSGTPLGGFSGTTWLLIAALAIGPQMIGHNGFNYALRHVRASTVGAIILLEPIGASLLAGLVLGEWPGPSGAVGAALAVTGVAIATLDGLRDDPGGQ